MSRSPVAAPPRKCVSSKSAVIFTARFRYQLTPTPQARASRGRRRRVREQRKRVVVERQLVDPGGQLEARPTCLSTGRTSLRGDTPRYDCLPRSAPTTPPPATRGSETSRLRGRGARAATRTRIPPASRTVRCSSSPAATRASARRPRRSCPPPCRPAGSGEDDLPAGPVHRQVRRRQRAALGAGRAGEPEAEPLQRARAGSSLNGSANTRATTSLPSRSSMSALPPSTTPLKTPTV